MKRVGTLILAVALFLGTLPSKADDLTFPNTIDVDELNLQQLGEYRYVYRFFFPLYEAALYAPEGNNADDVLTAESAFQLRFRYLRTIEKSIILKSADRMLKKNLTPNERASIAERVRRINQAYTTVREGDRSSLTFIPDKGTTLRINGQPRLTLPGRDFARLYFQIWLGPKPISNRLKANLLGRKNDS